MDLDSRVDFTPVDLLSSLRTRREVGFTAGSAGVIKRRSCRRVMERNEATMGYIERA